MRRALPIAIAMFLAGIGSYALSRLDRPSPPPSEVFAPTTEVSAPSTEVDELTRLDGHIAFYRARAEAQPGNWLDWENVANAYSDRARITGDYNDWQRAGDALETAFVAGNGLGPRLTRASFNFMMHRLDRVDPDLDAAERALVVSPSDRDAIIALRADVRYYSGRYDEARAFYERLIGMTRRSVDSLVMAAQLEWHTGHFEEAARLMDEALASPEISSAQSAPMRGWVLMTRAMMERDRGQLDDALRAIEAAHALVPDDPNFDEVAAEIHEARGEDDDALRGFRAVAARTTSPQSLDGIARVLSHRGDAISARELVGLARQSYDAQIALFPEAAYGHAIDHWLRLEPSDVDRMIEIAEGNAEARPYGETQVKLAMAYLLAGRVTDARRVIDAVLATEWQTADLHGVNAIVLEREGHDASSERAAAEAIARGAMDRLAWLEPAAAQ